MKDKTRQHLSNQDLWLRLLFMVLFIIAYSAAEMIVILIVIFQFFAILITGHANEPLLRFGNNLSEYIYQILAFQTFNSERRPFPFTPWPDEEPGGHLWLNPETADEEYEQTGSSEIETIVPDAEPAPELDDDGVLGDDDVQNSATEPSSQDDTSKSDQDKPSPDR